MITQHSLFHSFSEINSLYYLAFHYHQFCPNLPWKDCNFQQYILYFLSYCIRVVKKQPLYLEDWSTGPYDEKYLRSPEKDIPSFSRHTSSTFRTYHNQKNRNTRTSTIFIRKGILAELLKFLMSDVLRNVNRLLWFILLCLAIFLNYWHFDNKFKNKIGT